MIINKEILKEWHAAGKLRMVVDGMLLLSEEFDSDLNTEVVHQSSRLHQLKDNEELGILTVEHIRVEQARISMALLSYLDRIESSWEMEGEIAQTPSETISTPSSNTDEENAHKKTILFLASNPGDTPRMALDIEARNIEESLRRSKDRDEFRFTTRWAVRIKDLRRALLDEEPAIVHFSGHGSIVGEIVLEQETAGARKIVSKEALANLFGILKDSIEVVVLNACYSEAQADELVKHIQYVVGMSKDIKEHSARTFSEAFYDALGAGKTVPVAFALGKNAIEMDELEGNEIPVLKQRVH